MTITWDAREDLTVKYTHGYSDFAYTFDYDYDDSASEILDYGVDVLEDIYSYSHELQFLWVSPRCSLKIRNRLRR